MADGYSVTVRITVRGTHTEIFHGIAVTGWQTEITGIAIRRIGNGKIIEEWIESDQPGLMQQPGSFHLPAQANI